jgi:hypothetical protein
MNRYLTIEYGDAQNFGMNRTLIALTLALLSLTVPASAVDQFPAGTVVVAKKDLPACPTAADLRRLISAAIAKEPLRRQQGMPDSRRARRVIAVLGEAHLRRALEWDQVRI